MTDKKVQINKRGKGRVNREEILQWSREELIAKILQLDAYNFQIRNLLQKKLGQNDCEFYEELASLDAEENTEKVQHTQPQPIQKPQKRKFDFKKSHKRHVLMKLLYFGWDYHGLATQEDSNATIEHHLFQALIRTCLIESRETANYHRCGRTDKELLTESIANEIDYCALLNRVLPRNIQAVAWMPLRSPVYSARFDCVGRTYRYYFPKGDLNIEAMQTGCELLARHTDFRNFCKMDVNNGVTNYIRQVFKATVQRCEVEQCGKNSLDGYAMYMLEIRANAFLWHQIRCIMAVLLLIGEGKEQAEVISELLDVAKNPCKPQYTPAIGLPLNLFHCEFRKHTIQPTGNITNDGGSANSEKEDSHTTAWIYGDEHLQKLIENVQGEWMQYNIKSTMIRDVLHQLESTYQKEYQSSPQVQAQAWLLQDGVRPRQYQQLLNRKRCESLENRIEHFVKKQRLIVTNDPATQSNLVTKTMAKT
nr:tRNA pseudouridine(38/39) synthase isoform X3 [Bactrocera oleae]